jgi:hypothetical protein
MKKTQYIHPSTDVVLLETTGLLELSNTFEETGDVTLNPNTMNGGDGGDASRDFFIWDDY